MKNMLQKISGYSMLVLAFALLLAVFTNSASAQSNISQVVEEVSTYWDAVTAVAIGILLFVIGRRVVRKL